MRTEAGMKRLWLRPTGRTVFHAIRKLKLYLHRPVRHDKLMVAECKQRIVLKDTESPTIYCEDGTWWSNWFQCKRCL